jgi:hypothetical protein
VLGATVVIACQAPADAGGCGDCRAACDGRLTLRVWRHQGAKVFEVRRSAFAHITFEGLEGCAAAKGHKVGALELAVVVHATPGPSDWGGRVDAVGVRRRSGGVAHTDGERGCVRRRAATGGRIARPSGKIEARHWVLVVVVARPHPGAGAPVLRQRVRTVRSVKWERLPAASPLRDDYYGDHSS